MRFRWYQNLKKKKKKTHPTKIRTWRVGFCTTIGKGISKNEKSQKRLKSVETVRKCIIERSATRRAHRNEHVRWYKRVIECFGQSCLIISW